MYTNIEKQVPRAMTSYLQNVISANQHLASIFSMQLFKFQRRRTLQALLPFLALLQKRPREVAHKLALRGFSPGTLSPITLD